MLCQVLCFSDEMKCALREELVSICRGATALCSSLSVDSYGSVVRELVKRIESKEDDGRKGIIGELLTHLIVRTEMPHKHPASVLFNLEDGGYKKGFDLTLCDQRDNMIWFTEVKSGGVLGASSPRGTMNELLGRAKRDLIQRLDEDSDCALWLNAINHAGKALDDSLDDKQAVLEILDGLYKSSEERTFDHTQANAVLVAAVFDSRVNEINVVDVQTSHRRHEENDGFANLMIMVIQKSTYSAVMGFLRQEACANEPNFKKTKEH